MWFVSTMRVTRWCVRMWSSRPLSKTFTSMGWEVWRPQVRYYGPARCAACLVPADSNAACTAYLALLETLSLPGPKMLGFMCETLDQAPPPSADSCFLCHTFSLWAWATCVMSLCTGDWSFDLVCSCTGGEEGLSVCAVETTRQTDRMIRSSKTPFNPLLQTLHQVRTFPGVSCSTSHFFNICLSAVFKRRYP